MRWILFAVTCVLAAGCGVAVQPESAKTVAAFEVPLRSEADRNQFLAVLRAAAEPEGMHVDAETSQDIAQGTKVSPAFAKTMNAAVWRGANDRESVASAMDLPENVGKVWLSFSKGKDPLLTTRFRDNAMRQIMLRWPDTLSLPIMPTGAIPLPGDLIRTPNGYIVNPAEAHKYELQGVEKPGN
jgi:hypothetical protein